MKMAKAPIEEWERVMRFVNELEHELKYCEMSDEQLGKWVREKAPSMTRTVFGYSVLVDNCCDPNVTTLAWKPEWLEAMKDKERLDWMEATYHRPEFLMSLSQDVRDAIDAAMPETGTTT